MSSINHFSLLCATCPTSPPPKFTRSVIMDSLTCENCALRNNATGTVYACSDIQLHNTLNLPACVLGGFQKTRHTATIHLRTAGPPSFTYRCTRMRLHVECCVRTSTSVLFPVFGADRPGRRLHPPSGPTPDATARTTRIHAISVYIHIYLLI